MKRNITVLSLSTGFFFLTTSTAHAYIGPGGGLTAIGTLLALIAAVVVTFFGFLWYPIKRLRKMRRERKNRDLPPPVAPEEKAEK